MIFHMKSSCNKLLAMYFDLQGMVSPAALLPSAGQVGGGGGGTKDRSSLVPIIEREKSSFSVGAQLESIS